MSKLRHTIEQCGKIAQLYGLDFNPNADTHHFWRVMKKNKQTNQKYAVALAISKEAVRALERGVPGDDDCPPISFDAKIHHFDGVSCLVIGRARLIDKDGEEVEFRDVGEANPKNCQIAYPAAMAWKRAKQRCVLGILGLDGVYSEEESEDFERGDQGYAETDGPPRNQATPYQRPREAPQGGAGQQGRPHQGHPPPQQQPPSPQQGQGDQRFPPAKEPRAYVEDVERGAEPPLNPWSMTFRSGKYAGWTWVDAYKNTHADQTAKGGPIEDNYIRWYCREFGPSALERKGNPPTDFQVKMWATLLWMLRWVDPVSGNQLTHDQVYQGGDFGRQAPAQQPPSNQAPPPAGPHQNWNEGRDEPSLMDQPDQTPHPQANFGVPHGAQYPGQNLDLPNPKQPEAEPQMDEEPPF